MGMRSSFHFLPLLNVVPLPAVHQLWLHVDFTAFLSHISWTKRNSISKILLLYLTYKSWWISLREIVLAGFQTDVSRPIWRPLQCSLSVTVPNTPLDPDVKSTFSSEKSFKKLPKLLAPHKIDLDGIWYMCYPWCWYSQLHVPYPL